MRGEFKILVSDTLEKEIFFAPDKVKQLLLDIPVEFTDEVRSNSEVRKILAQYIENNVISDKHLDDTLHIATATVFRANALVSWNFKHIVNFDRIVGYDNVNLNNGYKRIQIITPQSFIY